MQYSALAVWEGSALWRGIDVLARIALVTSAMVTVATVFNLVRAEGLHYRIAGLNLLTAVIIYWNTVHLGHAVAERRTKGWMFP